MDLGFAGLIEKIEQYFGRPVAMVFLAIVLLVVLGWGIDWLISLYASGRDQWDSGGEDAIVGLAKFVGALLIIMVIFWIAVSALGKIYTKRIQEQYSDIQERVEERVRYAEEKYKKIDEISKEVEGMLEVLEKEKKDKSG